MSRQCAVPAGTETIAWGGNYLFFSTYVKLDFGIQVKYALGVSADKSHDCGILYVKNSHRKQLF
jgi:hypothetical protein